MLGAIEVGPWDHGLTSLGHKLVNTKRLSIPQGLVVGKALPDHAETYTSDEAASDPPSEVVLAHAVAPPDVVESRVPTAGHSSSHHGVSSQAGTVSSSPFPKSSPTSSSPMEVSSQ